MESVELEEYEARVDSFKATLLGEEGDGGKHTFVIKACLGHKLNRSHFTSLLHDVDTRAKDVDFSIIILVRLLFLLQPSSPDRAKNTDAVKQQILSSLASFPFWPSSDNEEDREGCENLCFWSENHILMLLGSAHLVRQFMQQQRHKILSRAAALEEALLLSFLSSGVIFEVLSHVYMPYTLSALFNLYDFSENAEVRVRAKNMIDTCVQQLMFVTTCTGNIHISTHTHKCTR